MNKELRMQNRPNTKSKKEHDVVHKEPSAVQSSKINQITNID